MMVNSSTTLLFPNKNKVMNDEGGQEDLLKCCQPTSSKMQMRQLSSTFYVYFGGVLGVWSRRRGEPFTLFDHDMMMHFISELAKGRGPPKWP